MKARDFDAALGEIQMAVESGIRASFELMQMGNSGLPGGMDDEIRANLRRSIELGPRRRCERLRSILSFPPHHVRHFGLLERFWREGTFDRSVFLMTKFPDPGADTKANRAPAVMTS